VSSDFGAGGGEGVVVMQSSFEGVTGFKTFDA
jgi:hypothetical protein